MHSALRTQLRMLANDGYHLMELALPGGQAARSGSLSAAISPFLAMYAVEVFDLLTQRSAELHMAAFDGPKPTIRTIRARLKLFDGDRQKFCGILQLLARCEADSVHWFNREHSGILGFLKRRIQDDLGLLFLNDDLVLTTHVALVHSFYGDASDAELEEAPFSVLSQMNHNFGYNIGQLLGAVVPALESFRTAQDLPTVLEQGRNLAWFDCKSRKTYGQLHTRMGTARGHAAPLTWLISQVNAAHRWIRLRLPIKGGLGFRIRFLTAFHALEGIKILGAASSNSRNTPLAALCAELLGTRDGRSVRKLTNLRNALAHYNGCDEANPDSEDPLEELVPHLSSHTLADLEEIIDRQLETMSVRFRDFTPKKATLHPVAGLDEFP